MTYRKYLVLVGVTLFSPMGDSLLSRGMKQGGSISVTNVSHVILAILNPWVALGTLCLLAFFACYMTALSWADLTYVLPATSLGYVLLALIAKYQLHEQISAARWAGIVLITAGVGFVAGGPELTRHPRKRKLRTGDRVAEPVSTRDGGWAGHEEQWKHEWLKGGK